MSKNKRRIHYINPAIQKRLMVSLIISELVLIGITVFWLYTDMDQLIENNLYRIHVQDALSAEFIIIRLTKAAIVLLFVNTLIASAIVWYWKNYVQQVIAPLEEVTDAMQQLDFTIGPQVPIPHEIGDIATQWFQHEKKNMQDIRQRLQKLDSENPASISQALQECRELIEEERARLG